jgi:hypothetical protein
MRTGWITAERAEQMLASFPEGKRDQARWVLEPLIDRPVRASAVTATDDGGDEDFSFLFQPRTRAEHERQVRRRERIAAARDLSDDAIYASLYPGQP